MTSALSKSVDRVNVLRRTRARLPSRALWRPKAPTGPTCLRETARALVDLVASVGETGLRSGCGGPRPASPAARRAPAVPRRTLPGRSRRGASRPATGRDRTGPRIGRLGEGIGRAARLDGWSGFPSIFVGRPSWLSTNRPTPDPLRASRWRRRAACRGPALPAADVGHDGFVRLARAGADTRQGHRRAHQLQESRGGRPGRAIPTRSAGTRDAGIP